MWNVIYYQITINLASKYMDLLSSGKLLLITLTWSTFHRVIHMVLFRWHTASYNQHCTMLVKIPGPRGKDSGA